MEAGGNMPGCQVTGRGGSCCLVTGSGPCCQVTGERALVIDEGKSSVARRPEETLLPRDEKGGVLHY